VTTRDSSATPSPQPGWTVLIIDDDPEYLEATATEIRDLPCAPDGTVPSIITTASFAEGMKLLQSTTVDVLVLDVRDEHPTDGGAPDEDRGVAIFEQLKALRFLPVVFFTAIEQRVLDLEERPLVQVVSKAEGSAAAAEAVARAFATGAPVAVRALSDHVREVMRQYLWEHIAPRWAAYEESPPDQLANLLAGRLAKSLEHAGTAALRVALGEEVESADSWHPSRMYILPPLTGEFSTGDLVTDENNDWFVLLTPDCDLAQSKADVILMAKARPLLSVPLFADWLAADQASRALDEEAEPPGGFSRERKGERQAIQARSKKLSSAPLAVIGGSRDRYFHLPAFLEIPDLLIDLQYLVTRPFESLSDLRLVASLNPPYAQALVARHQRYVGRVGLADVDTAWVTARLRKLADEL
jgi:CheY-like chemotaxis protein